MTRSEVRSALGAPPGRPAPGRAAAMADGADGAGAGGRGGSATGGGAGRDGGASSSSPRRRRSTTLKPGSGSRSDTDAPPRAARCGARGRARGSTVTLAHRAHPRQGAAAQREPMLYWPRPAGIACRRARRMAPDVEPGRRPAFPRSADDDGPPARRRRMSLGSRADPRFPPPVPRRGDLRGPRRPRHRRPGRIREELGDLLFQVVFHTEIARERGEFSMADLLEALVAKMTRRHPHVFGDRPVGSAGRGPRPVGGDQGLRGQRTAAVGARRACRARCPRCSAPSASSTRRRASGSTGPTRPGRWRRSARSSGRSRRRCSRAAARRLRAELGDLLFAVVNVARLASVDPEGALQAAVERFSRRFASMEEAARGEGRELPACPSTSWNELWTRAKSLERPP